MSWHAIVMVAALAASAAAQPAGTERAQAASHFKQGQLYYGQGDWDRAIAEYQTAFDLSREPLLVFNIGLCHDRAQRPEAALEAFQRYLQLEPNGKVADEAREDVVRLTPIVEKIRAERAAKQAREQAQEADAARAAEAARVAEQARQREVERQAGLVEARHRARRNGVLVIAAGGVFLVGGVVMHVVASGTRSDLYHDDATWDREVDTFRIERDLAIASYAVAAVGVGLGAWLYSRGGDDSRRVARRWVVPVVIGGAGVAVGGVW